MTDLEVGPAKVLVLVDVKPEVERVLVPLPLEKDLDDATHTDDRLADISHACSLMRGVCEGRLEEGRIN